MFLNDIDVAGRLVFVRTDLDVSSDKNGLIDDEFRIVAALDTVRFCRDAGARVVIASHLGKARGKISSRPSLRPIAARISHMLGTSIRFIENCIGNDVTWVKKDLGCGEILMLENLFHHQAETKNTAEFSAALAENVDVYVNDAPGVSLHEWASMCGMTAFVPLAVGGLAMKKELGVLQDLLREPKKPFVAVIGGARLAEKIGLIQSLLEKADVLLIGGGISYTFLKSQGVDVGNSLVDHELIDAAADVIDDVADLGIRLVLPLDNIVANREGDELKRSIVRNENIPSSWSALDIGPETLKLFEDTILGAKTLFWNGPLGVYEKEFFRQGTSGIARAIAATKAFSVICGDDSIAAVGMAGLKSKMSYLSPGRKASLDYLEGKIIPGIAALSDRLID